MESDDHCAAQGSLAPWLVLDQRYVRRLPAGLSWEAAASLPWSGSQAWQLLGDLGGLQPGEGAGRVLVWGGVRPLERLVVQLAAAWGCHTTCLAPPHTHRSGTGHTNYMN